VLGVAPPGPANTVIEVLPITTLLSPVVVPKLLTSSVSVPASAVTVRAAAMPASVPVLVGALLQTLIVSLPAPPSTVVGALIDWMFAVSFWSPRLILIALTLALGPVTTFVPLPLHEPVQGPVSVMASP